MDSSSREPLTRRVLFDLSSGQSTTVDQLGLGTPGWTRQLRSSDTTSPPRTHIPAVDATPPPPGAQQYRPGPATVARGPGGPGGAMKSGNSMDGGAVTFADPRLRKLYQRYFDTPPRKRDALTSRGKYEYIPDPRYAHSILNGASNNGNGEGTDGVPHAHVVITDTGEGGVSSDETVPVLRVGPRGLLYGDGQQKTRENKVDSNKANKTAVTPGKGRGRSRTPTRSTPAGRAGARMASAPPVRHGNGGRVDEEQLDTLQDDLRANARRLLAETNSLRAQLKNAQSRAEKAAATASQSSEESTKLRTENEALSSEIASRDREISSLNDVISQLRSRVDNLQDTKEKTVSEWRSDMQGCMSQISMQEERILAERTAHDQQTRAITNAVATAVSDMLLSMGQLEAACNEKLSAKASSLMKNHGAVAAAKRVSHETSEGLKHTTIENEKLQSNLESAREQAEEGESLKIRIKEMEDELTNLVNENARTMEGMIADNSTLQDKVKDLEKELQSRQNEMEAASVKHEDDLSVFKDLVAKSTEDLEHLAISHRREIEALHGEIEAQRAQIADLDRDRNEILKEKGQAVLANAKMVHERVSERGELEATISRLRVAGSPVKSTGSPEALKSSVGDVGTMLVVERHRSAMLAAELDTARKQAEEATARLVSATERNGSSELVSVLQEQLREHRRDADSRSAADTAMMNDMCNSMTRIQTELRNVTIEKDEYGAQINDLKNRLEALRKHMDEFVLFSEQTERLREQAEAREKQKQTEALSSATAAAEARANNLQAEIQTIRDRDLRARDHEITSLRSRLEHADTQVNELSTALVKAKAEGDAMTKARASEERARGEEASVSMSLREAVNEQSVRIASLMSELADSQSKNRSLESQLIDEQRAIEGKLKTAQMEAELMISRLRSDLERTEEREKIVQEGKAAAENSLKSARSEFEEQFHSMVATTSRLEQDNRHLRSSIESVTEALVSLPGGSLYSGSTADIFSNPSGEIGLLGTDNLLRLVRAFRQRLITAEEEVQRRAESEGDMAMLPKTELERIRNANARLEARMATLQSEKEVLNRELSALRAVSVESDSLRSETENLRLDLDRSRTRARDLEIELRAAERMADRNSSEEAAASDLQSRLSSYSKLLEERQEQAMLLEKHLAKHSAVITAKDEDLTKKEQTIAGLDAKLKDVQSELAQERERQAARASEAEDSVARMVQELEEKLVSARKEVGAKEAHIAVLEDKIKESASLLSTMKTDLALAEGQRDRLKAELSGARNEFMNSLETTDGERGRLTSELALATSHYKDAQDALDKLSGQHENAVTSISMLEKEKAECDEKILELNLSLHSARERCDVLSAAAEDARKECSEIKSRFEEVHGSLRKKQSALERSEEDNARLQARVDSMLDELKVKSERLASMESNLVQFVEGDTAGTEGSSPVAGKIASLIEERGREIERLETLVQTMSAEHGSVEAETKATIKGLQESLAQAQADLKSEQAITEGLRVSEEKIRCSHREEMDALTLKLERARRGDDPDVAKLLDTKAASSRELESTAARENELLAELSQLKESLQDANDDYESEKDENKRLASELEAMLSSRKELEDQLLISEESLMAYMKDADELRKVHHNEQVRANDLKEELSKKQAIYEDALASNQDTHDALVKENFALRAELDSLKGSGGVSDTKAEELARLNSLVRETEVKMRSQLERSTESMKGYLNRIQTLEKELAESQSQVQQERLRLEVVQEQLRAQTSISECSTDDEGLPGSSSKGKGKAIELPPSESEGSSFANANELEVTIASLQSELERLRGSEAEARDQLQEARRQIEILSIAPKRPPRDPSMSSIPEADDSAGCKSCNMWRKEVSTYGAKILVIEKELKRFHLGIHTEVSPEREQESSDHRSQGVSDDCSVSVSSGFVPEDTVPSSELRDLLWEKEREIDSLRNHIAGKAGTSSADVAWLTSERDEALAKVKQLEDTNHSLRMVIEMSSQEGNIMAPPRAAPPQPTNSQAITDLCNRLRSREEQLAEAKETIRRLREGESIASGQASRQPSRPSSPFNEATTTEALDTGNIVETAAKYNAVVEERDRAIEERDNLKNVIMEMSASAQKERDLSATDCISYKEQLASAESTIKELEWMLSKTQQESDSFMMTRVRSGSPSHNTSQGLAFDLASTDASTMFANCSECDQWKAELARYGEEMLRLRGVITRTKLGIVHEGDEAVDMEVDLPSAGASTSQPSLLQRDADSRISELVNQLETKDAEIAQLRLQNDRHIPASEQNVGSRESSSAHELEELKNAVAELEHDIVQKNNDLVDCDATIAELRELLSKEKDVNGELQSSLESSNEKVTDLESTADELRASIKELHANSQVDPIVVTRLETVLKETQQKLEKTEQERTNGDRRNDELSGKLEEVQGDLTRAEGLSSALRMELESSTGELALVRSDLESATAELKSVQGEVERLQHDLKQAQHALEDAATLGKDNDASSSALSALMEERDALLDQKRTLEENISVVTANAEQDISKLKDELRNLQINLGDEIQAKNDLSLALDAMKNEETRVDDEILRLKEELRNSNLSALKETIQNLERECGDLKLQNEGLEEKLSFTTRELGSAESVRTELDNANQERDALARKLDSIQDDSVKLNDEIAILKEHNEKLEKRIYDEIQQNTLNGGEIERLLREAEEKSAVVARLENMVQEREASLHASEENLHELQNQLSKEDSPEYLRSQLHKSEASRVEAEIRATGAEEQLKSLGDEVGQLKKKLQRRASAAFSDVDLSEDNVVSALRDHVKSLEEALSEVELENEEQQAANSNIVKVFQMEIGELHEKLEAYKKRIDELERGGALMSDASLPTTPAKPGSKSLMEEYTELDGRYKTELESNNDKISSLTDKLERLEATIQWKDEEIENLQLKCTAMDEKCASMEQELFKSKKDHEMLKMGVTKIDTSAAPASSSDEPPLMSPTRTKSGSLAAQSPTKNESTRIDKLERLLETKEANTQYLEGEIVRLTNELDAAKRGEGSAAKPDDQASGPSNDLSQRTNAVLAKGLRRAIRHNKAIQGGSS